MDSVTVPVVVDDRKDAGEFRMTRAAYFYIEALEPSADIPVDPSGLGMSVLPLEFSGVLHKPLGAAERFETPEQIEALFRAVERHETLYVDSDNLWVPNGLFDRPPERGAVYRIPFAVFARLYTPCRDDASVDAGAPGPVGESGAAAFSAVETRAYEQWAAGIVAGAKAAYPMNRDLALQWRE
jgi:hypothetical protein